MLAKLHRAGEQTAVWVPDAAHQAMRDLVRVRATAMRVTGKARPHLQGFLLRHGRVCPGKKGWTGAYRRWLALVRFTHPARQFVLHRLHRCRCGCRGKGKASDGADRGASADMEPRASCCRSPGDARCRVHHRGDGGGHAAPNPRISACSTVVSGPSPALRIHITRHPAPPGQLP